MRFAVSLGFLGFVARRLIHETGMYEEFSEQVEKAGLLTRASIEDPSPGPDDKQLAVLREWLPLELAPPESWRDRYA